MEIVESAEELETKIIELKNFLATAPGNTDILNALIRVYEQAGDQISAGNAAKNMVSILLKQGESTKALKWLHEYQAMNPMNPIYRDVLAQLNNTGKVGATPISETMIVESMERNFQGLQELANYYVREISLGTLLTENEYISQEAYDKIIEKLDINSDIKTENAPISFLCELNNLEMINIDRIISFLSNYTGMAYIDLGCFKIPPKIKNLMPQALAERLGLVIFGECGTSIQIAILNPIDQLVTNAIANTFNDMDISFFLCSPRSFTTYYDKLKSESS